MTNLIRDENGRYSRQKLFQYYSYKMIKPLLTHIIPILLL